MASVQDLVNAVNVAQQALNSINSKMDQIVVRIQTLLASGGITPAELDQVLALMQSAQVTIGEIDVKADQAINL